MHSNVSSIGYIKCIQVLANNFIWAEQIDISKSKELALFYVSSKIEESNNANEAKVIEIVLEPHDTNNINICDSQVLKLSIISYSIN